MRDALRPLLLTTLLMMGCEDGKPVTPAPEEKPSQPAPTEASPPPATPPPEAPRVHGATGVGDTAPAPERQPPKVQNPPPSASEWGQKSGMDGGSAPDAGGSRPGGPRPGEAKGPARPSAPDASTGH